MTRMAMLGFALCVGSVWAQTRVIAPAGLARPNGYSHVVVAAAGPMVFISGQVANDEQGRLVGGGDLEAQTEQVFRNLKAALAAAGCTFKDVVKLTYFVRDFDAKMLGVVRGVRDRYVDKAAPPASSLVGVAALFQPGYLIEVEAVAVGRAK